MTGQTIAQAQWRALDREGEDKCRLARVASGWMLVGHARFRDDAGFAALDYVVRCDTDWHTLSADVAGTHAGRDVQVALEHTDSGWRMNGADQPGLATASDVDLAFTPATNLMPLRRLGATSELETCAAWLSYPELTLAPLDQTYRRISEDAVSYAAQQTGYTTVLAVDGSGFVTLYPGFWEGEVHHAA